MLRTHYNTRILDLFLEIPRTYIIYNTNTSNNNNNNAIEIRVARKHLLLYILYNNILYVISKGRRRRVWYIIYKIIYNHFIVGGVVSGL